MIQKHFLDLPVNFECFLPTFLLSDVDSKIPFISCGASIYRSTFRNSDLHCIDMNELSMTVLQVAYFQFPLILQHDFIVFLCQRPRN